MFLGLRTVIYRAHDLDVTKAWFTAQLGFPPYFDEPFFVGFNVGGYELGLLPVAEGEPTGSTTYWGVPDADDAMAGLLAAGATPHEPIADVGEGIRIGAVREPGGNVVGFIENPVFALPPATDTSALGRGH